MTSPIHATQLSTQPNSSLKSDEALPVIRLGRKVLGIIGDGQLGRMLTQAAQKLDVYVKILGSGGRASSAGAIADECVPGSIKSKNDVADFATQVNVLVPEIEHIDVSGLSASGQALMVPSPKIVALIQNKFEQKQFFAGKSIPLGEYGDIPDEAALKAATEKFGFPCMLKSKCGAYDGRGNYVLNSLEDPALESQITKMGGFGKIYIEKWQPYTKELAVIVVRGQDGEVKTYPVTQTIQRNNICFVTETPANIEAPMCEAASQLARSVVDALEGVGVFGVEMFLLEDGTVLLNEVAPRVHNSGHYTLSGCTTSQFENHVRAAFGMPLGSTDLTVPHVIMYNLLGEHKDPKEGKRTVDERIALANSLGGYDPLWYAKAGEVTLDRKVGHINMVGKDAEDARRKLQAIDEVAFDLLTKISPLPTQTSMGSRVISELAS